MLRDGDGRKQRGHGRGVRESGIPGAAGRGRDRASPRAGEGLRSWGRARCPSHLLITVISGNDLAAALLPRGPAVSSASAGQTSKFP